MKAFPQKQGGWVQAVAALAPIVAGGIASAGQKRANEQNIDAAREQMRFQERMSNTAYQRAAMDLEKAGLNRILALGNPASTPTGAMPIVGNEMSGLAEGVGSAPSSALQAGQAKEAINLTKAQTADTTQSAKVREEQVALTKAQVAKIAEETRATAADAEMKEIESGVYSDILALLKMLVPAGALGAAGGAMLRGRGNKKKSETSVNDDVKRRDKAQERRNAERMRETKRRMEDVIRKHNKAKGNKK